MVLEAQIEKRQNFCLGGLPRAEDKAEVEIITHQDEFLVSEGCFKDDESPFSPEGTINTI